MQPELTELLSEQDELNPIAIQVRPKSDEMISKGWECKGKPIATLYYEVNVPKAFQIDENQLDNPAIISRLDELFTYDKQHGNTTQYLLDRFCSISSLTQSRNKHIDNADAALLLLTHIPKNELVTLKLKEDTRIELPLLIQRFFTNLEDNRASRLQSIISTLTTFLDNHYKNNRSEKIIHLSRILNSELFSANGIAYQALKKNPMNLNIWKRYRNGLLDKLKTELMFIISSNGAHKAIIYANAFVYQNSPLYNIMQQEPEIAITTRDHWNITQRNLYAHSEGSTWPTMVRYLILIKRIENLLEAELDSDIRNTLNENLTCLKNSINLQVKELISTLCNYSFNHYLLEINNDDLEKEKNRLKEYIFMESSLTEPQQAYFFQLTEQIISQNSADSTTGKKQMIPYIGFLKLLESSEDYASLLRKFNTLNLEFNTAQQRLDSASLQQVNHNWEIIEYFILNSVVAPQIGNEYKTANAAFLFAKTNTELSDDFKQNDLFFPALCEFYIENIAIAIIKPITPEIIKTFKDKINTARFPLEKTQQMLSIIDNLAAIAPRLKSLFSLNSVDLLNIFQNKNAFFTIISDQMENKRYHQAISALYQYRMNYTELGPINLVLNDTAIREIDQNNLAFYFQHLTRVKDTISFLAKSSDSQESIAPEILADLTQHTHKIDFLNALQSHYTLLQTLRAEASKIRRNVIGYSLISKKTCTSAEKTKLYALLERIKHYLDLASDNGSNAESIVDVSLIEILKSIKKGLDFEKTSLRLVELCNNIEVDVNKKLVICESSLANVTLAL